MKDFPIDVWTRITKILISKMVVHLLLSAEELKLRHSRNRQQFLGIFEYIRSNTAPLW